MSPLMVTLNPAMLLSDLEAIVPILTVILINTRVALKAGAALSHTTTSSIHSQGESCSPLEDAALDIIHMCSEFGLHATLRPNQDGPVLMLGARKTFAIA